MNLSEDIKEFLAARKRGAVNIARSVFLCIISPVLLIIFLGLEEMYPKSNLDILGFAIGLAFLSILVTIAVAIIVFNVIVLKKYDYIKFGELHMDEETKNSIKAKKEEYIKTYVRDIVVGVVLCIISIIPLIVCVILHKKVGILLSIAVLLIIVGFGVYRFVKAVFIRSGYDQMLGEGSYKTRKKQKQGSSELKKSCHRGKLTTVEKGREK